MPKELQIKPQADVDMYLYDTVAHNRVTTGQTSPPPITSRKKLDKTPSSVSGHDLIQLLSKVLYCCMLYIIIYIVWCCILYHIVYLYCLYECILYDLYILFS